MKSSAVNDAVDILHDIRQQVSTVIGVISHVDRLFEVVPTVLEVKKGEHGSRYGESTENPNAQFEDL